MKSFFAFMLGSQLTFVICDSAVLWEPQNIHVTVLSFWIAVIFAIFNAIMFFNCSWKVIKK